MNKAKKMLNLLEQGTYIIDPKNLKDPDQELADWIDARLAKARPQDQDVYDELVALSKKLRAKGK
jgi:replication-associated recombination protein RarA